MNNDVMITSRHPKGAAPQSQVWLVFPCLSV